MRFSFKKALATVLSIALVLSTCVCALTVGAATSAGSIDIPDATVTLADGQFTTTATINFDKAYEFVYVAYQPALPEGVTLVSADSSLEGAAVTVKNGVILVHVESSVQSIPVRMTFATTLATGTFNIGIAHVEYAESSEADLTLDIADTGAITIGHECVAGEPQIENNVDPTCTTAGSYDTVTRCTVCNEIISSVHTDVDALGHSYDEGVVTTKPDCENAGVKTFTCGVCGDTYTEAVDALGHTEVEIPAVEATCTTAGSTVGVKCSVCDAVITAPQTVEALGHNYVDGTCSVCGEADPDAPQGIPVDPELVIYNNSASLAFGPSSLEMNFKVRKTVLELQKYARIELVIVPQKYDLTTKNLIAEPTEIVIPASEFTGTSIRSYKYTDMMLYELALDVNYKLRGYDAQGNVTGESILYTTSPVSYLKTSILGSASVADSVKKLAVDILVVCEEARKAMAKAGTDLEADSKITVLDGVDLKIGSEQTLTGECAYTNNFTPIAEGWGTTITSNPGVSIDKVPVLNARLRDNKALDLSKLELRVIYDSVGAAGHVEESLSGDALARATNFINAKFYKVGLHDSNAEITVEYWYDGEHTATLTYYIEAYLYSQKDHATIGKLSIALVKLGESFRAAKYPQQ